VNVSGDERVNIKTADENTLAGIRGLTQPIAHAIVVYRGQHQFQSIVDLLDVTNATPNPVISEDLFTDIADSVTTDDNQNLSGIININTASLDVLVCLPNLTRELAQAIISQRQSAGYFNNLGELLKLPDMSHDLLKQIAPLITTRSETYRILCEGRINSTGTRQRIEATIHVGLNDQQILSWREDDL
jgi:DNA uptake protein ComE-like DNA-binding protein